MRKQEGLLAPASPRQDPGATKVEVTSCSPPVFGGETNAGDPCSAPHPKGLCAPSIPKTPSTAQEGTQVTGTESRGLYWSCGCALGDTRLLAGGTGTTGCMVGGRGRGEQRSQLLRCTKHKEQRGAGRHAAARCPPRQGEGTAGRGSPAVGLAHLAVPSAAASSAGSRSLPPAKSRRRRNV